MENFSTVLITLVTVLGSAGAWRFYEKKLDAKKPKKWISNTIVELVLKS
jgi:hypothetical protein